MYLAENPAENCRELLARGVVLSGWYTIYPWDCADHAMAVLCEMGMDRVSWLVSDGRGQGSQLVSATGAKVRGWPGPCGRESSCPCTSQQKKGIQNILLDIAGETENYKLILRNFSGGNAGHLPRGFDFLSKTFRALIISMKTIFISSEVRIVGLDNADRLAVLQGCPGIPGASGPKGEPGLPGTKAKVQLPGLLYHFPSGQFTMCTYKLSLSLQEKWEPRDSLGKQDHLVQKEQLESLASQDQKVNHAALNLS
ncbi:hypothetical protein QYF61_011555 [Mycteria americana]|uniref:Uncharacterized protein n=1 Tax=Mycteria americana TaxID=33587 RepID=A0AAN7NA49_MYCAM|nr:hypothetical protein QYF61_011555 [Mycteria americana]